MLRAIALSALLVCASCLPPGNSKNTPPRALNIPNGFQESSAIENRMAKNETSYVSQGCGLRNLNIMTPALRNSARQTNFAELPWTIMIFHTKGRVPIFKCGGSLIDRDTILTAAHCVKGLNASSLVIRAGEYDTQSNAEPLPHQDRKVANFTIHPEYADEILYNDLALLFLEEPLELAENVDTICLPDPDDYVDSHCLASGWGKDEFGETGHYQVVLKSVELSVDPPKICQNMLRSTRLGKHFELHESFICASGVDGADTCTGDGGGPLICPLKSDQNRYAQVGVVSWGIGCGQLHIPGVYADVAKARKWIDEVIALKKFEITPPANSSFDTRISELDVKITELPDTLTEEQKIPDFSIPETTPAPQVQKPQEKPQKYQPIVQQQQSQAQVIVIHQNQPQQQQPKVIFVNHPPLPPPGFAPNFINPFDVRQNPTVVFVPNYPRNKKVN